LSEELGQTRVFAEEEGQNTGGHWIQSSQMSYGFFASRSADYSDYVVRGDAGGFVENKKTIHAVSSLAAIRRFPADELMKGTHSVSAIGT
jgi:hypothetical protein